MFLEILSWLEPLHLQGSGMSTNEELASMYSGGMSLSQVSEAAGVPVSRVRAALVATGTAPRGRNCGIGKDRAIKSTKGIPQESRRKFDYAEAAMLYQDGHSINQIAADIGVDDENVRYALKALNVKRRDRGAKPGASNHQFKGGEALRADGYVLQRGTRAKPLQHRVIAERALGRQLRRNEVVHHINCIRSDNRPENLLICTQEYHTQLHARMRKHPYWSQF